MLMKNSRLKGNEMKKMFVTLALAIILITPFALAASAFTEFSGSGDLSIKTTIDSSYSDLEVHTGCEACCCCPDCPDDGYEGYQFISSNPFMASTETTAHEGCVDIEIFDTYDRNGEVTYTETHTGFIGGGTASAFLMRDENEGYSSQYVNADGDSFVFFYQDNFIDGEFDYATTFGGIVEDSENGTAEMNTYFLLNSPSIIVSDLRVECDPFGKCYTMFDVATTDVLAMNAYLTILDDIEWYSFVGVDGTSLYIIVTESNKPIDFGFAMEVG